MNVVSLILREHISAASFLLVFFLLIGVYSPISSLIIFIEARIYVVSLILREHISAASFLFFLLVDWVVLPNQ